MTPLAELIAAQIAMQGPMRLDEYMQLCLLHPDHGYYTTREPFGTAGDFTTAPEISQIFGEVIGAAVAQAWLDQGSPRNAVLAEIGPGRGTLMADVLRVMRRLPGWDGEVMLIEASPRLRVVQAEKLGPVTHLDHVDQLPERPLFLLANEFYDALPIRQFTRRKTGWAEVMVTGAAGKLAFGLGPPAPITRQAAEGAVYEICEAARPITAAIAGRIARNGGAAILIDYGGWDGEGDTLQALQDGKPADPLAAPGLADLTAHVDFAPIAAAAREAGAQVSALEEQGALLARLGIGLRAEALAKARPDQADSIAAALERLTSGAEMGKLFKALALWSPNAPPVPGFRPASSGQGTQTQD